MSVKALIKCAGCRKPVPSHAPALIIGELSPDMGRVVRRRHYHEMYAPAAVDSLDGRSGAFALTHRTPDAAAN